MPLCHSHVFCLLLAISSLLAVATTATGSFDLLTYNVAGLPAFLNDNGVPGDKGTNANTIGSVFASRGYDVINLQEDFAYHAYIYATDTHSYRTPTSGSVPFGDGLNTIANYGWTGLTRTTWERCSLNSGDCLTPKGFTFMRITIDAAEVDLYNLHADAGSNTADAEAREAGIDQILSYISANSVGKAIIIAGDTNDRWTNSALSINKLSDAGFQDPWVDLVQNGVYPTPGSTAQPCGVPATNTTCEVVDKVFYRSGDGVALTAESFYYDYEYFVQPDGNILSDHNPVRVMFSYST